MDTNGSHYHNLIDDYYLIKNQYGDILGKMCWNGKKMDL